MPSFLQLLCRFLQISRHFQSEMVLQWHYMFVRLYPKLMNMNLVVFCYDGCCLYRSSSEMKYPESYGKNIYRIWKQCNITLNLTLNLTNRVDKSKHEIKSQVLRVFYCNSCFAYSDPSAPRRKCNTVPGELMSKFTRTENIKCSDEEPVCYIMQYISTQWYVNKCQYIYIFGAVVHLLLHLSMQCWVAYFQIIVHYWLHAENYSWQCDLGYS